MAANYWASTQRRYWIFTREQLVSMRAKLDTDPVLTAQYPLPDRRLLSIYFRDRTSRLHASSSHPTDTQPNPPFQR